MKALLKDRHPETEFASPRALSANAAMPEALRIEALEQWELTIQDRLAASNEGMPSNGDNDADLKLLGEIGAELARLKPKIV